MGNHSEEDHFFANSSSCCPSCRRCCESKLSLFFLIWQLSRRFLLLRLEEFPSARESNYFLFNSWTDFIKCEEEEENGGTAFFFSFFFSILSVQLAMIRDGTAERESRTSHAGRADRVRVDCPSDLTAHLRSRTHHTHIYCQNI